jgi:signal peptidase II
MAINVMLKKNIYSLLIVLTVFFLDRVSKYIILKISQPLSELNFPITTFLNFNLVWNNGIAFGLFSFDQNIYYNLVTSIIILVTLIIIWLATKSKGLEKISYLMIIGGSFGNMFDRLYYSSVIDFIDISYNNFHWFIFNVADIFITLGVIILISLEFIKLKKT